MAEANYGMPVLHPNTLDKQELEELERQADHPGNMDHIDKESQRSSNGDSPALKLDSKGLPLIPQPTDSPNDVSSPLSEANGRVEPGLIASLSVAFELVPNYQVLDCCAVLR